MTKSGTILGAIACLTITVLTGLGLFPSRASYAGPGPVPPETLRGLSKEEIGEAMEKWRYEARQKRLKDVEEWMKPMMTEAWKHLLRVSDYQWKTIEPRKEKAGGFADETHRRVLGWGGATTKEGFRWQRHSKGTGGSLATPPDKMTEGQKIADVLADLLEDPNSTDEQIRDKVDALQQARENARKAMPKAKQELAAVLTTPRQEAVFLLIGLID